MSIAGPSAAPLSQLSKQIISFRTSCLRTLLTECLNRIKIIGNRHAQTIGLGVRSISYVDVESYFEFIDCSDILTQPST